ncbi:MAG: hypothetical protein DMF94_19930 [Acidobacteria bacterium]|nr:MAG: hypothetical protein DMF94_19930 [Acidobacteriota bacterium]
MTDGTGSSRSLFTNMAYAGVSAASAGLLLILFVVAGRFLGDIEFGKFSFALMLGTIFETLMDFGFHQVIIREVARDGARARDLLGHTLGIKLLWAGGGLVTLLVTATVLRFRGSNASAGTPSSFWPTGSSWSSAAAPRWRPARACAG